MSSADAAEPPLFQVDFSQYPPSPVLWFTCAVDTLCFLLPPFHGWREGGCTNWREALGVREGSWLSYQVPYLSDHFPKLITYDDYAYESCPQNNNSANSNNKWSDTASCLYGYAFRTESTALGDLSTPAACLMLLVLVIILRQIKSVLIPIFRSIGRNAGRKAHGPDWERDNEIRISKFGEYVFRLLYHSLISMFGIVYFWDKEWWTAGGTLSLFAGFPYHPVEPGMAWYYLLQSAYNVDALLSLLSLSFTFEWKKPTLSSSSKRPLLRQILPFEIRWSQDVRGDFREMFVHHVVTNLLVVGSSRCRLTRIGSMVFLVHDISDIPVDLSKLANFLKYKITTIACFVTMAALWFVTRLYILPFTIYRAVLTQSHYVLEEGLPPILYMCYRQPFYVLIGLLILLHLAWFGIFIQIFYTIMAKHECHDYSEHKKGEGNQQPKMNGNKITKNTNTNGHASSSAKLEKKRSYNNADEKKDE